MSTHNICFRGEIRKMFTGYPPLSRPMDCGLLKRQNLQNLHQAEITRLKTEKNIPKERLPGNTG